MYIQYKICIYYFQYALEPFHDKLVTNKIWNKMSKKDNSTPKEMEEYNSQEDDQIIYKYYLIQKYQ